VKLPKPKGGSVKKLASIGALVLVVLMGVVMGGCYESWCYEDDSPILGAGLRCRITRDFYNQVIKPNYPEYGLRRLKIEKEYGVFDGYVVVRFNFAGHFPTVMLPIDIGGVMIDISLTKRIIAWKNGQMFSLFSAQENNILSQASLQEIALMTLSD
jgi:hypothetical protein